MMSRETQSGTDPSVGGVAAAGEGSGWNYSEAFCRNAGLISEAEQERLRTSRVAIAGMGGVGGVHLATLARLGVGRFTIADPDTFETANTNRQYGARTDTLGRPKAEVMAEEVLKINPQAEVTVVSEPVSARNIGAFLDGADLFVDGLDFFAIDARRVAFQEAREAGIWGITAGPHAFSVGWLMFSPTGMSFDEYFDMRDSMSDSEKVVAFAVGTVPAALHLPYLNLAEFFRPGSQGAASVGFACQLASGIVGAESVRILLGRADSRSAPYYFQFDAYRRKLACGRVRWGNRSPLQRIKRWWLQKKLG